MYPLYLGRKRHPLIPSFAAVPPRSHRTERNIKPSSPKNSSYKTESATVLACPHSCVDRVGSQCNTPLLLLSFRCAHRDPDTGGQPARSALHGEGSCGDAPSRGWHEDRILVIDQDLGLSARRADNRKGFQKLLAEVTMEHVGMVLGLEMSRLAR